MVLPAGHGESRETYLINFSKSKSSSLEVAGLAAGLGVGAAVDLDLGQATTPTTLPKVAMESWVNITCWDILSIHIVAIEPNLQCVRVLVFLKWCMSIPC